MTHSKAFLLATLLALSVGAQAESIRLSPGEIANLGIRFEMPLPATELAASDATARVIVPPAGEAVVAAPLSGLLSWAIYGQAEGETEMTDWRIVLPAQSWSATGSSMRKASSQCADCRRRRRAA